MTGNAWCLLHAHKQGSHFLENQGMSGNFVLAGMSGNFDICQRIFTENGDANVLNMNCTAWTIVNVSLYTFNFLNG